VSQTVLETHPLVSLEQQSLVFCRGIPSLHHIHTHVCFFSNKHLHTALLTFSVHCSFTELKYIHCHM